jgi:hypothetical protein
MGPDRFTFLTRCSRTCLRKYILRSTRTEDNDNFNGKSRILEVSQISRPQQKSLGEIVESLNNTSCTNEPPLHRNKEVASRSNLPTFQARPHIQGGAIVALPVFTPPPVIAELMQIFRNERSHSTSVNSTPSSQIFNNSNKVKSDQQHQHGYSNIYSPPKPPSCAFPSLYRCS